MISIIYAGNQSGTCYGIFKLLTQKLENKEKYIFNLQLIKEDILILEKGYKHELTDKQNKFINIISQSDTLIFIYPLYWLNMPMLLKGFIDMTFWPNEAFSFKNKQYYKNGLWKDKKAIVIYTIGGSEWFNLLNLNLGYRVLKYPLNLVGISNIKKFYIDQLNRSNKQSVNKKVNSLVEKVMKSI